MTSFPSWIRTSSRPIFVLEYDATTRPGLRDFILMMGHVPDHFRRYNEAYLPLRFDNHLGPRQTEIVRLAVSQTTRCPVCMAGRVKAATDDGLTEDSSRRSARRDRERLHRRRGGALDFTLKFATDHLSITDADREALRGTSRRHRSWRSACSRRCASWAGSRRSQDSKSRRDPRRPPPAKPASHRRDARRRDRLTGSRCARPRSPFGFSRLSCGRRRRPARRSRRPEVDRDLRGGGDRARRDRRVALRRDHFPGGAANLERRVLAETGAASSTDEQSTGACETSSKGWRSRRTSRFRGSRSW